MALWLTELGIQFRAVFADTGWEHQSTIEYVTGSLPKALGCQVEVVRSDLDMIGWIRRLGMFPSRTRRWCSDRLKRRPIRSVLDEYRSMDPISSTGVRAEESRARASMSQWERERDWYEVWRPIFLWPVSEVYAIHARHGVTLNPLYTSLGASRVGCWPCVMADLSSLALVAETDAARIDTIRELEVELGKTWFDRPIDEQVARALRHKNKNQPAPPTPCSTCACSGSCGCA